MNTIFKRTSVRKYLSKPVPPEQVEMLMKAGMAAPSAKNFQPWEFVAIQNRETLLKITEFHPYSFMLKQAPLAIVVCADTEKEIPDLKGFDYWVQDCSAATQNIMLQATEMGLGSVWLGTFPREQIYKPLAELLGVPANIVPFSIIAIGYPDGETEPKNKFDSKKIHYEKW
ncbi:MAG: nitroreductase family protein [Candidatus Gastranaerophilaceae bacterium]